MGMRSTVLVAALAAACGGSNPTSAVGDSNPPPPAGQVVSVSMSDYRFTSDTVRIAVGTTVRWTNDGTLDHTSTGDAANGWDSGTLAPPRAPATCPYPPCNPVPATFEFTFTAPGSCGYHCAFHGVPGPTYQGMIGAVVVTP